MIYQVTHTTTYHYQDAVSLSHHVLRLSPRQLRHQRCLEHGVITTPVPAISQLQAMISSRRCAPSTVTNDTAFPK